MTATGTAMILRRRIARRTEPKKSISPYENDKQQWKRCQNGNGTSENDCQKARKYRAGAEYAAAESQPVHTQAGKNHGNHDRIGSRYRIAGQQDNPFSVMQQRMKPGELDRRD
jgi:hypothetical protein